MKKEKGEDKKKGDEEEGRNKARGKEASITETSISGKGSLFLRFASYTRKGPSKRRDQ